MQNIIKLQAATLAARTRTGDKSIATSAESGLIRIERVSYDAKGNAVISPLSGNLSADKAIEFLNAL